MGKYNTIELKMMFKQLLIICLIATVVVTNSRFPVNEKPGTIARYFINRHEQRCYESLLPSAIAMSFQVGTCKSQGFPVKKNGNGNALLRPIQTQKSSLRERRRPTKILHRKRCSEMQTIYVRVCHCSWLRQRNLQSPRLPSPTREYGIHLVDQIQT